MTAAIGFLRHNDSLVNLASLLEEHHYHHNTALDDLLNVHVGDSTEVKIAKDDEHDDDLLEQKSTTGVEGVAAIGVDVNVSKKPSSSSSQLESKIDVSDVTVPLAVPEPSHMHTSTSRSVTDAPSPATTNPTTVATTAINTNFKVVDYDDYYGNYDLHAPAQQEPTPQNMFACCLFPLLLGSGGGNNNNNKRCKYTPTNVDETIPTTETMGQEANPEETMDDASTGTERNQEQEPPRTVPNDKQVSPLQEESSTPTGEPPSAVLIAATEATRTDSSSSFEKNQSSIPTPTIKGILKKTQTNRMSRDNKATATRGGTNSNKPGNQRRAIFNTLYANERAIFNNTLYANEITKTANPQGGDTITSSTITKKLKFSPMARVLMIDSYKDMTASEKTCAWWRKSDYIDFKKTSRFVTQAMLQKGSEVWLMTNPSWNNTNSTSSNINSRKNSRKNSNGEEKEQDDSSDKWWCQFGHSRRGLEHVTSPEEGRERQRNVVLSIEAVLNEQKRQKQALLSPDVERIRKEYIRYNSWARELCLAAGASDAEAVRSNFRRGRCRDFYIVERRSSGNASNQILLDFMKQKQYQAAQISTRPATTTRQQQRKLRETTNAIHDAPTATCTVESMSKMAVGFGAEVGTGKHLNMSDTAISS